MLLQSIIRAIYPPQCVACESLTDASFGLCAACWSDTAFISGLVCDKCGTPLFGDEADGVVLCDDCMTVARPWDQGRAVMAYSGVGRRLILGLKHSDRTDLVPALAGWMAQKAGDFPLSDTVIVPVPLHWSRLLRRRYNQSAMLALALAKKLDVPVSVDGLLRVKRTKPLDGHSRDARFAALSDALTANPARAGQITGKAALLVDDVMTSGATLAAATEALRQAGAVNVSIVTLARVVKDT